MSQKDSYYQLQSLGASGINKYMIHLLTPGPVPLSSEQLSILSEPMIHHRSDDFCDIFADCLPMLSEVYQTAQPVMCLTSTGSGALEAAVVNLLSEGDNVLALINGKFGERWAEMAETFGCSVDRVLFPNCLLYTSPSPRDATLSRMPSSA